MPEDNLFLERERLLKKGTVSIQDIRRFAPCGYIRAKRLYDLVVKEVEKEDKTVGDFGVETKRILPHLYLTEKDVYKAATLERQIKKDA